MFLYAGQCTTIVPNSSNYSIHLICQNYRFFWVECYQLLKLKKVGVDQKNARVRVRGHFGKAVSLILNQLELSLIHSLYAVTLQRVQGRDVCSLGRQRQRGEPQQLVPAQGRLRSALGPGPGGTRAVELPVCGRQ